MILKQSLDESFENLPEEIKQVFQATVPVDQGLKLLIRDAIILCQQEMLNLNPEDERMPQEYSILATQLATLNDLNAFLIEKQKELQHGKPTDEDKGHALAV